MRIEPECSSGFVQRRERERRRIPERRQMIRFESVGRRALRDRRKHLNVETRINQFRSQ